MELGAHVGLTGSDFVLGVRNSRYEEWVLRRESFYQAEDPQGTPAAWLNGTAVDSRDLFDRQKFKKRLRIS